MNNRWTHPVPWLQEQMDILLERTLHMEREISRLRKEVDDLQVSKADRRGPKPKQDRIEQNRH